MTVNHMYVDRPSLNGAMQELFREQVLPSIASLQEAPQSRGSLDGHRPGPSCPGLWLLRSACPGFRKSCLSAQSYIARKTRQS